MEFEKIIAPTAKQSIGFVHAMFMPLEEIEQIQALAKAKPLIV